MSVRFGVGTSKQRNTAQAGKEAAERALREGGIERADLVLLFATVGYDQQALVRSVRAATGGARLAGCSAAGTIVGTDIDESRLSVTAVALQAEAARFDLCMGRGVRAGSQVVGATVGEALSAKVSHDATALFVFGDGLGFNFDRFTAGLAERVDLSRVPMLGGLAGDNLALQQTYQYCDDEVLSDAVVCVLTSGGLRVASAVSHGCVTIGRERTITRCEGNLIFEIDDKPVIDVLREYIGDVLEADWAHTLGHLALAFEAAPEAGVERGLYIRSMTFTNLKDNRIMLNTEVRPGQRVHMGRRDFDRMCEGVDTLSQQLKAQLAGATPAGVMQFDCVGRGKLFLRDDQKKTLQQRFLDGLGAKVPGSGFYAYGEIGPVNGQNCFHNYSSVVAAFASP